MGPFRCREYEAREASAAAQASSMLPTEDVLKVHELSGLLCIHMVGGMRKTDEDREQDKTTRREEVSNSRTRDTQPDSWRASWLARERERDVAVVTDEIEQKRRRGRSCRGLQGVKNRKIP